MFFLETQVENEVLIDKSRFIAVITPVKTSQEIQDVLKSLHKSYPKATHYCTAYILGNDGLNQGSNDDGEPSGTAGVPILEILRHHQLTNVFCVVIRYFGGIKLGAGGLIRAYAQATKSALNEASLYKIISAPTFKVHFDYQLINLFENQFKDTVEIVDKQYGSHVSYTLVFHHDDLVHFDQFKHHFIEIEDLGTTPVKVFT